MDDRRQLVARLQRAWQEVRAVAEEIGRGLAAPPLSTRGTRGLAWPRPAPPVSKVAGRPAAPFKFSSLAKPAVPTDRYLVWVDAVGGFLLCLSDEVVLGQAAGADGPHVPLQADLSRRHATIRRDGEGYSIEPLRGVKLDGRPIDRETTLSDGRIIELGEGVRLQFRRPHPLSATARLDLVSHHRTQPSTDGILLMADSCIVGSGSQSHIVNRQLAGDVVLFRQGAGLACRATSDLSINGVPCGRRGPLVPGCRVQGSEFSFMLEEA